MCIHSQLFACFARAYTVTERMNTTFATDRWIADHSKWNIMYSEWITAIPLKTMCILFFLILNRMKNNIKKSIKSKAIQISMQISWKTKIQWIWNGRTRNECVVQSSCLCVWIPMEWIKIIWPFVKQMTFCQFLNCKVANSICLLLWKNERRKTNYGFIEK